MSNEYLREAGVALIDRADRLDKGEPLCRHHWSGDPGYECYCTGCNKHIGEYRSEDNIPFKSQAYCCECQKTPEEKEKEKREREKAEISYDLKKLNKLLAKYPDHKKLTGV